MKVIDFTNTDIEKACEALILQLDCRFDLVVGIAEGGRLIAECIAQKLHLPFLPVIRQRSLTQTKYHVKKILKYIPKKILNLIRITENRCLEFLSKRRKNEEKTDNIHILSNDLSFFKNPYIKNILLVDDAIDSGSTVSKVEKFLLTKNNHWNIKVAVITQTFNQPMRKADYQLYNKVLIRFPWSNDFKS